jgi:hypothetical protein
MFDINNNNKNKLHKSPFRYDLENQLEDKSYCKSELERFKTTFYQLKTAVTKGLPEDEYETATKLMQGYNSLGKIFRRGGKSQKK